MGIIWVECRFRSIIHIMSLLKATTIHCTLTELQLVLQYWYES